MNVEGKDERRTPAATVRKRGGSNVQHRILNDVVASLLNLETNEAERLHNFRHFSSL